MSSRCSEPGTAVRAGEFANYMILLLIILIMSTLLGDISLCYSIQVLNPQDLHLGTHPDPLWGSQALRGAGRAPSPQRLPKGGGRWDVSVPGLPGAEPGDAPQGIPDGFRENWKGPLWFSSTHSPGAAPAGSLPCQAVP